MQIGLYYGQFAHANNFDITVEDLSKDVLSRQLAKYERLIDFKIFDPSECSDLLHCTPSTNDLAAGERYIQLMLSKAEFVNLNLMPKNAGMPMSAKVSYRLINSQEHTFIVQTLVFMGIGFILLFLFMGLLFRALNPKSRGPDL